MYDNPEQTERLLLKLEDAVPLRTPLPLCLMLHLKAQKPHIEFPEECWIKVVMYAGHDMGITCRLDLGLDDVENVFVIAITHLDFDPRLPETRDIRIYQKHRVKRLRSLAGHTNKFVPLDSADI